MRRSLSGLALLLAAAAGRVSAQDAAYVVPAMTPVVLEIGQEVSSKTSKPGDRFALSLAEDLRVGDVVVIPAHTPGEGEVVHAAKSGAGGKAGELILAARFLRVRDVEVRLRSMSFGAQGKDRSNESLATAIVAGPFAMFVRGGNTIVPAGAIATAKIAAEIQLPAVEPETPPAGESVDNPGSEEK